MSIVLERDIQRAQMLTGGYVTEAAIARGGEFDVSLPMKLTRIELIEQKYNSNINFRMDYVSILFVHEATNLKENRSGRNIDQYLVVI